MPESLAFQPFHWHWNQRPVDLLQPFPVLQQEMRAGWRSREAEARQYFSGTKLSSLSARVVDRLRGSVPKMHCHRLASLQDSINDPATGLAPAVQPCRRLKSAKTEA